MTEPESTFQQIETNQNKLTMPLLFLSSEGFGWEDVSVQAYHEPAALEGWIDPVTPDIVLVLLNRGTMLLEYRPVDSAPWQSQPLRQNDLILKPIGYVTDGELRWHSLSPEPMQTIHLHLNSDLFSRTVNEVTDRDPANLVLQGRTGFQDPLLLQIGLALRQELEEPTAAGKLYAQTAAQLLAVHLLRHYAAPIARIRDVPQGKLTRRQVGQVNDYILAHLGQDLSLSALAQQIGFSPYHFARLFRQTTGESPHQFVLRQRVERAQYLLTETDTPLAQIALESGFANQSHLTRTFNRFLGHTPRGYRRNY